MYLISVTTFIWSVKKGGSQIFFINTMLRYRISFYILYFNKIKKCLPTNIPSILLNKDLLIFVPGPSMVTTFISNRYEYDKLTQFFPRFNFYSPLSRSKTPTYPCVIFYFWLTKVLTSERAQIRLTCIRNIC